MTQLLHKDQLALTSRLLKQLRKCLNACGGEAATEQHLVELSMLLSLVARKLLPGELVETSTGATIRKFAGDAAVDSTEYCRECTAAVQPSISLSERAWRDISRILKEPTFQTLLLDPCLAGWIHQAAHHKPRWKRIGTGADNEDPQSARAADLTTADVPGLTQWFTPHWIGRFLAEQTIAERPLEGFTWLDPAAGAGHLLIHALRTMHGRLTGSSEERLKRAIESIYGCDVDAEILKLARFAMYLEARDLGGMCELPSPKVFASVDDLGSLGWSMHASTLRLQESMRVPLPEQFDGIATNPPYLSHRLMPEKLATFAREHYRGAHFDLYACFLKLGSALTKPGGTLGIICQQSFLSIQRYADLRMELFSELELIALAQLGAGSFGGMSGEKVNNAIFVAKKKVSPEAVANAAPVIVASMHASTNSVRCWRLLDDAAKREAEIVGLDNLPAQLADNTFAATISGAPLSFWCPPEIAELFDRYPSVQDPSSAISVTNGLFTCNNKRFVKHFRDVPIETAQEWVPYDKGGGHKWFHTTPYMVHWKSNGDEIRSYRAQQGQSASLPGEQFYRMPGVTYSYIGTKSFRARLLSPGSVFDIASSSLFSETWDCEYLVGWLNSSLIRFLLGVLNPTINFQIGDIRRLPFATPDQETRVAVTAASKIAIALAQGLEQLERDSDPQIVARLNEINEIEQQCQATIDKAIFDLYRIPEHVKPTILADPWVARGSGNLCDVEAVIRKLSRIDLGRLEEQLK